MASGFPGAAVSLRRLHDGTSEISFASPALAALLGLPAPFLPQARPLRELVRTNDWENVEVALAASARDALPLRTAWCVEHPVRGPVVVEIVAGTVKHPDGSVAWHGVMLEAAARRDVTREVPSARPSHGRLPRPEEFLRSLLDTTPELVLSVDHDLRVLFINRVSEHPPERVIGSDVRDFLVEASRPVAEAALRRVFSTGCSLTYEVEGHAPDGGVRRYATHVGPVLEDGVVTSATLAVTDITNRDRIARELRASEERFRGLVEFFPYPIFIHRGDQLRYCNQAFHRLLGTDGRAPTAVFDFVHPDAHALVRGLMAAVTTRREPSDEVEIPVVRSDGAERRARVVARPIVDQGEEAVLVTLHDVTDEEHARGLLESVTRSVRDAIITTDQDGRVMMINPSTAELFGLSPEELVGQNVKVLIPEPFRGAHDAHVRDCTRTGINRVIGVRREVLAQRKDGSTFPAEVALTSFRLGGRQYFTAVARDLTERKRLEDQFRQAHKMEAFGQLAGGVAHDFNNLLTVILGETEMLASTLEDDREAAASLDDIRDAAERAAVLTKQLLAFSRKTVLEPRVLDVNTVIHETEKMLRRLIGEDIHFVSRLTTGLPLVKVDPGQLTQILMNLAVNARDAMPRGGELAITTSALVIEDGAAYGGVAPGRYVAVSVRDSGVGMSEEVKSRVFQPFFTTKEAGKGTGLGLAVVHGIVAQSGGGIRVESIEGKGSVFELILPAATSPLVSAAPDRAPVHRPAFGAVLLVEDDESVRRFATRVLSMQGYSVIGAPDGEAAMAVLAGSSEPVRLVITDVVMPAMDGADLGERLRRKNPALQVLYVSGYTEEALSARGLRSEAIDFLAKPYTAQSLLDAVERTLSRS